MHQSEYLMRQGESLKRLRESPGYEALVELLMEWQRDVFQAFLVSRTDEDRLEMAVKGKVLQDLLVLIDNRIESSEDFARRQIEASKQEAQRQAEEAAYHERVRRNDKSVGFL